MAQAVEWLAYLGLAGGAATPENRRDSLLRKKEALEGFLKSRGFIKVTHGDPGKPSR